MQPPKTLNLQPPTQAFYQTGELAGASFGRLYAGACLFEESLDLEFRV